LGLTPDAAPPPSGIPPPRIQIEFRPTTASPHLDLVVTENAPEGYRVPRPDKRVRDLKNCPSLNLMADNGCQPTSLAFMRSCAAMRYSNPSATPIRSGLSGRSRRSWSGPASGPADRLLSSPRPLDRRIQRRRSALGARLLPLNRNLRSRTPQPRHSLTSRLLHEGALQFIAVMGRP
jgi:hypothetical protein